MNTEWGRGDIAFCMNGHSKNQKGLVYEVGTSSKEAVLTVEPVLIIDELTLVNGHFVNPSNSGYVIPSAARNAG